MEENKSKNDDYNFILMTHQNCPHCGAAKGLEAKGLIDKFKIYDISKDKEAVELANKYNLRAVPSVIVKGKEFKDGAVCNLSHDLNKIICNDKIIDIGDGKLQKQSKKE